MDGHVLDVFVRLILRLTQISVDVAQITGCILDRDIADQDK